MCLAVFALHVHPRYPVVIAANRDEFHARSTAPARWWPEGWLAGQDLVAGGTWLGIDRRGRWALLTNIRDPARHNPQAPSRGKLVPRVLAETSTAAISIPAITAAAVDHNGFNLVGGDLDRAAWGSNCGPQSRPLHSGVHGLSNHLLDTPWPKVLQLKEAVATWCARAAERRHREPPSAAAIGGSAPPCAADEDPEPLFAALADRTPAPDDALPHTGISRERERALSAAFIVGTDYGTRCSTLLLIGHDGGARFIERSFDPTGQVVGVVDQSFVLLPG